VKATDALLVAVVLVLVAAAVAPPFGRARHGSRRPRSRIRRHRPVVHQETALYRCYDDTNQLAYVGVSNHLGRRLHQHERSKPWWRTVSHITVAHYPTRNQALDAETRAIRVERPRWNVTHNRQAHR
jgi:excinuclease UvrABC nuclease subunit